MKKLSGIGLGLRFDLAADLLAEKPDAVRWLEIHPENYLQRGGHYARILAEGRQNWRLITHGLTSCFGSLDPFDPKYLRALKVFLHDIGTPWHSEHLCFGGVDGQFLHDLIPLPFTKESAELCAQRAREM